MNSVLGLLSLKMPKRKLHDVATKSLYVLIGMLPSTVHTNFNFPHSLLDIIFQGSGWKSLKSSQIAAFRNSTVIRWT